MMYDFLIVGSGLFGLVFSEEVRKKGYTSLIIDKRTHIGGNIHCENISNINVHKYGPHIFHTNSKRIWDYVNSYCSFNNFRFSPIANYDGKIFNLPFNMNTFYQLWGLSDPLEVKSKINQQIVKAGFNKPRNLEEQAISMVGTDIYFTLIKGYTEKQWGRDAKDLPPSIIKRIPVRFTYDNSYFNDQYQGIPIGGYNVISRNLLGDKDYFLEVDYLEKRDYWNSKAKFIVYTGAIDEYYEYKYDTLDYRSLKFDTKILNQANYQGSAMVNYTSSLVPFTRKIEHKHFEFSKSDQTVITTEYPQEWDKSCERFYPVNDLENNKKYEKYRKLALKDTNIIFGGRLAEYKYYDMHQVIGSALNKANEV